MNRPWRTEGPLWWRRCYATVWIALLPIFVGALVAWLRSDKVAFYPLLVTFLSGELLLNVANRRLGENNG